VARSGCCADRPEREALWRFRPSNRGMSTYGSTHLLLRYSGQPVLHGQFLASLISESYIVIRYIE
jgi:hypothetical protein